MTIEILIKSTDSENYLKSEVSGDATVLKLYISALLETATVFDKIVVRTV